MTAVLDPKLEQVKKQIEGAFAGAPLPGKDYAPGIAVHDASSMACAMLAAYHTAAEVNPAKAFRSKAFTPHVRLADPAQLQDKAWWNTVLDVIQTVAPVVINAVSKDYTAQPPQLASIIQALPAERRNDPGFVDYATSVLLNLGQATVQAMSGEKDFRDPNAQIPIPQPPPGMDKGWFDDVCDFVSDAAPIALPIIMSLL
jgi:hypothetical protein